MTYLIVGTCFLKVTEIPKEKLLILRHTWNSNDRFDCWHLFPSGDRNTKRKIVDIKAHMELK